MIYWMFIALLYLSIFVSGVNEGSMYLSILISFLSACLGIFYLIKQKKSIKIPNHFAPILIFILIMNIYVFFIPNKLNPFLYSAIMSEGVIFWIVFLNIDNNKTIVKQIFLVFSLLYSLIFIVSKLTGLNFASLSERYFQEFPSIHYYYNCFWIPTIILILKDNLHKVKPLHWLIFLIGIVFLIISNSRSSYISLIVGIGYIAYKKLVNLKLSTLSFAAIVLLIMSVFIFFSGGKTTLFSRPYFAQSIQSFPKHVFGTGYGNFKQISESFNQPDNVSQYAHNILLEALSGVGIFSILFCIFIIILIWDITKAKGKSAVWGAVILSILTNFMFDISYTIPGFVWLFFISIGVFQSMSRVNK
jgi:hypothetical protein